MSEKRKTELTPYINKSNIGIIREQIAAKISHCPYYATSQVAMSVITDQDHFPYSRYFRGVPTFSRPVVFEREAGWRNIDNQCYQQSCCVDPEMNDLMKVKCVSAYR